MRPATPSMQIDLRQAIYALTDALDLVGVDEVQHGKRVGFMAEVCGEALGLQDERLERLFHAALLHDCGVSSTRTHKHLVGELQWDGADQHCQVGADRLEAFPPLAALAPLVRFHHTPWVELREQDLPDETRQIANLIFLVDRVDALAAPYLRGDLLVARDEIRQRLVQLRASLFAPELVELFLDVSHTEAFWIMLEAQHLERFLHEKEKQLEPIPLAFDDLKRLAGLFAHIVDAKSPYTAEHSRGVARLSRELAQAAGLAPERCEQVEVAGLLHDLGKLRVPDEILDKPGSLSYVDRATMLRHSFETWQILRRIDGLGEIALWAAYHHEAPDGNGYPFHLKGVRLDLEARIIAVADVFQALAQRRPYRPALPPDTVMDILWEMAKGRRVDPELVELLDRQAARYWRIATGDPADDPAEAAARPRPRGAQVTDGLRAVS